MHLMASPWYIPQKRWLRMLGIGSGSTKSQDPRIKTSQPGPCHSHLCANPKLRHHEKLGARWWNIHWYIYIYMYVWFIYFLNIITYYINIYIYICVCVLGKKYNILSGEKSLLRDMLLRVKKPTFRLEPALPSRGKPMTGKHKSSWWTCYYWTT